MGLLTLWKTGTQVNGNGTALQTVYTGIIPANRVVTDGSVIWTQWGLTLNGITGSYQWNVGGGATIPSFDTVVVPSTGQGRYTWITIVRRSSSALILNFFDTGSGNENILTGVTADWTQNINLNLQFLSVNAGSALMEYSFGWLLQ